MTIAAHVAMGLSWRSCAPRALAAALALAAVAGTLVAANSLFLGRVSLSPMGSLFLYARLDEDGLIPAWLDLHCGRDAPERAVTTPVAAVALLLLPFAITYAWRRRNVAAVSLLAVVATGLLVNAAMAGALSDVQDRYQSHLFGSRR